MYIPDCPLLERFHSSGLSYIRGSSITASFTNVTATAGPNQLTDKNLGSWVVNSDTLQNGGSIVCYLDTRGVGARGNHYFVLQCQGGGGGGGGDKAQKRK